MSRFRLISVLISGLAMANLASAQAPQVKAKPRHALSKVAHIMSAPVTHPVKSLKDTIGAVLFAGESVIDVIHLGTAALDKGAGVELKVNPFHYANIAVAKADDLTEAAEQYFFGTSN